MAKHRKASHNSKRFGASAMALAGASGALIGLDGVAHAETAAADKTVSKFTIKPATSKVAAGDKVRIRGNLQSAAGTNLGNRLVYLQRADGKGNWSSVASTRTYSSGVASRAVKHSKSANYRWYFRGDDKTKGSLTKNAYVTATQSSLPTKIVKNAAAQAGDPYSYGATGPDSFDCSGLTQYAHKLAKKSIPRTASQQYSSSKKVAKGSKKAGDLIFFHDGGSVYHTGVYAGSGKIWHAPQSGDVVRKADIWTSSYSVGRYW